MRIHIPRVQRAILASVAVAISGCAGFETQINSLSFHEGQAESNEEILLRNIIAAAHDKTPTFVAASQVTSKGSVNATLSATFDRISTVGHTLTPGLESERSQNVTIFDYGATKAAKQLYDAVPPNLLRQLIIQGWPDRLIKTVLYSGVRVIKPLDGAIRHLAERTCQTPANSHDHQLCTWTNEIISRCGDPADFVGLVARKGYVAYLNNPRDICDFQRFQVFLNRLHLTGSDFTHGKQIVVDAEGKKKAKDILIPDLGNPHIINLYNKLRARAPFQLALRSPKQIIDFLGRLAAMQLYADPPNVPRVPILVDMDTGWVAPFRVVSDLNLKGPSAISAHIHGLGKYHVPQPEPLGKFEDQSLRVMGIVIELQNRARQEAPIQATNIAIVQ